MGQLLASTGYGGYYDLILTAETIYNEDSQERLLQCIKQVCFGGIEFLAGLGQQDVVPGRVRSVQRPESKYADAVHAIVGCGWGCQQCRGHHHQLHVTSRVRCCQKQQVNPGTKNALLVPGLPCFTRHLGRHMSAGVCGTYGQRAALRAVRPSAGVQGRCRWQRHLEGNQIGRAHV